MANAWKGTRRVLAFARKEVAEVVGQPRLVILLILGPFVILGLFGAGYKSDLGELKAAFVGPPDSEFTGRIEQSLEQFGTDIAFGGRTSDEDEALGWLRDGEVDLVVVVPQEPLASLGSGRQSVFEVYHDRLNPWERYQLYLAARDLVEALNRQVLGDVIATGQQEGVGLEEVVTPTLETASRLRVAAQAGNRDQAGSERDALADQVQGLRASVAASATLLGNLPDPSGGEGTALPERLGRLEEELRALDLAAEPVDLGPVDRLEAELNGLLEVAGQLEVLPPSLVVQPFGVESRAVAPVEPNFTGFYAPGVIALLMQHMAVTVAALSLVRERALGTLESFRVAPVGPNQILVGKYLGYLPTAAVVAAVLSAMIVWVFRVPMVGEWWAYGALVGLLVMTSLGLGFVVSALVTSDGQAVNVTMILLLLSVFFSGFFLDLDRLTPAVRAVSWALPSTHAIDSLRDVMFRGTGVNLRTWLALGGGSIGLFLLAGWLHRRRLAV